jgi:mono/diheme cytochrome c family protein
MKRVVSALIAVALLVVGTIGFAYSGLYDHRASTPHSGLVKWLLSTTAQSSIKRQAKAVDIPDLRTESLVQAGINDFNSMCAGCHGAPGRSPEAVGLGLSPPAPDLADSATRLSPAELFWVTKHGVRMTGMPAWGATHDDESLWPVVAFMLKLPDMDAADYQALLSSAAGKGHHANDAEPGVHGHNSPEADHHEAPADGSGDRDSPATAPHDHSTHDHDAAASSTVMPFADWWLAISCSYLENSGPELAS